jgi:hypothetical protein
MTTPAGWYDDGSGKQRWWDGAQWTDRYQESPAAPPVPPTMPISGAPVGSPMAGAPLPPPTQVMAGASGGGSNKGKIALIVAAAVVLLAGLGAGVWALAKNSEHTSGKTAWDSLSQSERSDFKTGFLEGMKQANLPIAWDDASAECVGSRLVNQVGMTKLKEYGLENPGAADFTAHPLSLPDASALSNAVVECAPNDGAIKYFQSKFDEGMGNAADATQQACMHNHLGRQVWIDLLTSEYDGQAAAMEATLKSKAQAAAKVCLV